VGPPDGAKAQWLKRTGGSAVLEAGGHAISMSSRLAGGPETLGTMDSFSVASGNT